MLRFALERGARERITWGRVGNFLALSDHALILAPSVFPEPPARISQAGEERQKDGRLPAKNGNEAGKAGNK
jgi:hypothetical protein